MTREEAIRDARAEVELEAGKVVVHRYHFGTRRWVVGEARIDGRFCVYYHTLEGPTVIGEVRVEDDWEGGGTVTASIFNKGLLRLGSWTWSESNNLAA